MSSISFSWETLVQTKIMTDVWHTVKYFHLPPLFFSFFTSLPMNAAIPRLEKGESEIILEIMENRILYAEIPCGKDIHSFQSEASKHLDRPSTKPSHSNLGKPTSISDFLAIITTQRG